VNELEIEERTQAALLPLLLFFLSVFFSSLLFLSTASTVADPHSFKFQETAVVS